MDKIKLLELFSGIQSQEKSLNAIGVPYESVGVCELDKDCLVSASAMRFNLEEEISKYNFPSKEDMILELQCKNIGWDFKNNCHTITNKTNIDKVKLYYICDKLLKNIGDISLVTRMPYSDLLTYSFPCTDLSVAGKGEGMVNKCECGYSWPINFSDSSKSLICPKCGKIVSASTRSGLLGQVQRLISIAYENNELPKYLLLENVKNLVGKKFKSQFDTWISWLDSIGYTTYWKVLNSKHYGMAQNRERIFAVSIRKDIDNKSFEFPNTIPLTMRLRDILEKNVDEKYYLPDERIKNIISNLNSKSKKNEINILGNYMPSNYDASRVVSVYGIAPCVKENHGTVTAIVEPQVFQNPHGFNKGSLQNECPAITSNCFQENNFIVEQVYNNGEYSYLEPIIYDDYNSNISKDQSAINTLTRNCGVSAERNGVKIIKPIIIDDTYGFDNNLRVYTDTAPTLRSERIGLKVLERLFVRLRIRKLTPKECWRLMGFTDDDFDKASKYVGSSLLYKQAGNSIVTNCLIGIFIGLFKPNDDYTKYLIKINNDTKTLDKTK